MVTKAILVGTVSATRTATVLVPEGFTAAEIVAALNSGEAVASNKEVQLAHGNRAIISSHEVDGPPVAWELKDVITGADAEPADHSCESCSCGGHHHHHQGGMSHDVRQAAENALKEKLGMLNRMVFEFIGDKNLVMARKIATSSSAILKALDGVACEEAIWAISNKSFICSSEGRHALAVKYSRQALKMADAYYEARETYAVVLNNTGEVLVDAGRFVEAERALMEGIGILNLGIEKKSCDLVWARNAREDALQNLGRVYKSTGRETEAFELMDAIRSQKD